jgi:hypothetical protein
MHTYARACSTACYSSAAADTTTAAATAAAATAVHEDRCQVFQQRCCAKRKVCIV